MPNPACEKCKPDKPQDHPFLIEQTGCQQSYDAVDKCMKANQGNVSSCRQEWKDFQNCVRDREVIQSLC